MKPIHPGRILKREMKARELSANKLSLALRVPSGRITQILNGKRGISAETALRLARYFGNSPQFWINLQSRYELAVVEKNIGEKVIAEVTQPGDIEHSATL
jgi:addiction module HigA family antidote